jgi:hypothetical protein
MNSDRHTIATNEPTVVIDPPGRLWRSLVEPAPGARLFDRDLAAWRVDFRRELGLPDDRPIVATGHQTLLWHPGILAKYLAVEAATAGTAFGRANLVVDQHADGFGSFPVPTRRDDGSLTTRWLQLTRERPRVPMALHPVFRPQSLPVTWNPAIPSVRDGVAAIVEAITAHQDAPNAAMQMAGALQDLMRRWVREMPQVSASQMLHTSLARRLLESMVEDPQRCVVAYNDAVDAVPEAGIGRLLVRDDYVELPLWRARETGERMRAYDGDVERWLEDGAAPPLFPRALMLTALVRLGMCDLFVHGTGGAIYDRAMEEWLLRWLGVMPAARAIASATLRLPLSPPTDAAVPSLEVARTTARRAWHDPESIDAGSSARPGEGKRELLRRLETLPRDSMARRKLFHEMHGALAEMRQARSEQLHDTRRQLLRAERQALERPIIDRRSWPFPLYAQTAIDALNRQIRAKMADRTEP